MGKLFVWLLMWPVRIFVGWFLGAIIGISAAVGLNALVIEGVVPIPSHMPAKGWEKTWKSSSDEEKEALTLGELQILATEIKTRQGGWDRYRHLKLGLGEDFGVFVCFLFGVPAGFYIGLKKSWWLWLERLLSPIPTAVKSTVVEAAKAIDEIQETAAENRKDRREDENQDYALAMQEIQEGTPDPGLWARAYAESGGDEKKQRVVYLKLRVEQLRS